jgi:hypothetical protein
MSEHMFRYSRTARIDASQHTTSNHIKLHEDGGIVVEIMVQYLYEGDYNPTLPSMKDRTDECGMHWRNEQFYLHPQTYELGRKYLVKGLANLAVEKFEFACSYYWDTDEFRLVARFIARQAGCFPEMLKIVVRTIAAHKCLIEDEDMRESLKTQQHFAYKALKCLKDSGIL